MTKQFKLIVLGWVIAAFIAVSLLSAMTFSSLEESFNGKAASLHRLVSQRADQHDAHLTGLSALASAGEKPLESMMLSLSETIQKFYARIEDVDLVKLDQNNPVTVFSTRQEFLQDDLVGTISAAAYASEGQLQILPSLNGYFLVKRSPNSAMARYGLALFINAEKLIENDLQFPSSSQITLKTLTDIKIYSSGDLPNLSPFTQSIEFSRVLGSSSQPFTLIITRHLQVTDYVRWQFIVPVLLLGIMGIAFSFVFVRQRQQTKRAEERALLGEHEARIAKASRINGLGEMASGLAHEITQPLTAILSQSQAGLRLMDVKPNDVATLKQVLGNISVQAKRGGDIVKRLRSWTTHSTEIIELFELNAVVKGILELMKADLKEKQITTEVDLSSETLLISADRVAIEQVIFNLSRNAVDAMEGVGSGHIKISTYRDEKFAILALEDNGKGLEEEAILHLFEPFYSTKEKGMGLGLSLCETIIHKYNGHIEIKNNHGAGVTAFIRLPLAKSESAE